MFSLTIFLFQAINTSYTTRACTSKENWSFPPTRSSQTGPLSNGIIWSVKYIPISLVTSIYFKRYQPFSLCSASIKLHLPRNTDLLVPVWFSHSAPFFSNAPLKVPVAAQSTAPKLTVLHCSGTNGLDKRHKSGVILMVYYYHRHLNRWALHPGKFSTIRA